MSDHTQHDEAAQLRAVIYDLKATRTKLAANARIAELEAGQPHVVDPEKWDYTSEGKPVTDLVNPGTGHLCGSYPWESKSLGWSWTSQGKFYDDGTDSTRDLIPTPKATTKGDQPATASDKHKGLE
jgi:hypothetical protein